MKVQNHSSNNALLEEQKILQISEYFSQSQENKKAIRTALLIALILHIVILIIRFPVTSKIYRLESQRSYVQLKRIRFPDQPKTVPVKPINKNKVRILPIPDPTPDAPEPLLDNKLIPMEDTLLFEDTDLLDSVSLYEGSEIPTEEPPVRLGKDSELPTLILEIKPDYPEEARSARIEGTVIVEAVINKDGTVSEAKLLKSVEAALDKSAIIAVKQWKFLPAKMRGKPVRAYFTLSVSFKLQ